MIEITNANFEAEVIQSEKPVLIDFWATWCGPCQSLTPELEALSEAYPDLIVGKINVEEAENIQLAASMGVNSIPAMFFYRNGKLEKELIGFMTKDELIKKLGL